MSSSARRLTGEVGRWSAGHPWIAAATSGRSVLISGLTLLRALLALRVLRLHTATPGASDLPQATAALRTYNRIQQVFPGGGSPAVVVGEAPDITVNPARTAAIIQVPLVLLDATIVRALLLPAVMKLLGPRNWYLPRWLGWLPRTSHPAPPPTEPPAAPPSIGPPPVTRVGA
jgi:uncharacterized membrane protein YdfJ with MMPL/SSD domain